MKPPIPDGGSFSAALGERARDHPDQTALIEPHGRISFADLDTLANRYANGLVELGVRRGDRVLYLLQPSICGYAAFYALLRLGAVPVFVDPRMGLRKLLASVQSVDPPVVLAVPVVHALRVLTRGAFAATRIAITAGRRWFWGGARLAQCRSSRADFTPVPVTADDECFLPFTSGSTGPAKAVRCDYGMVRHQLCTVREVCGWSEEMRIVMAYAPFVPYALADGLTVILPDIDFSRPAAASPVRVADAIDRHRAGCAFASPIIWMRLARYCERTGTVFRTLERAVTAGAPVPMDLHRRLQPLLHPEGQLYTPYGATEAMPVTTTNTAELRPTWEASRRGHGTCVGTPLSGNDVSIIGITDDAIPEWRDDLRVPEGAVGEIVVGGAGVSRTYPAHPLADARSKIRREGRVVHRTGDLGRWDAEGRLWFCGRKDHRIETRGGLMPSTALENIFNQHPAVFRTAVVGVGERGDQTPVLCVEMEPGHTLSDHVRNELLALADGTPYERRIRHVIGHRQFPVDARHNSKIRREELAAWAARRMGRERDG